MHRRFERALAATLIATLAALTGCDVLGNSSGASCGTYLSQFDQALQSEGALTDEVAVDGPYPMALILSQDAINRLFAAIAGNDLPPLTLSERLLGVPVSVTLRPELPLIQVGGDRGCAECLLTEMGFGLTIDIDGNAVSGDGSGRYQFPLALQPNGLESTSVQARLGESSLVGIDLQISGIDDTFFDLIEPIIAEGATFIIQQRLGNTELFELGAWSFGDGDVKLLGRGPIIEPDFGTVVIGFHSNLIRPLSGTVEVEPSIPVGADLGLQLHPELIQTMIQRMLHEGNIGRSYNEVGQSDATGDHQVTLNLMQAGESGLMRTNFRLWRNTTSLCGYADLQADLGLSISDGGVALAVENIAVTDGAGVGELLVAAGDWVSSSFTEDLINFSELTINYREFALPGGKSADMSADSFRLDLDARGLSVFLNIDAIIDAE